MKPVAQDASTPVNGRGCRQRKNFSDQIKAEIYARDRATCVYSGASLWILDYGASPDFVVDWPDHVVPAAHGGSGDIANGVAAVWWVNHGRGTKTCPTRWFENGQPRPELKKLAPLLNASALIQSKRFSPLHYTDWYLNRAVFHVLLGVDYLANAMNGDMKVRDDIYRARAAFKHLTIWRSWWRATASKTY